MGETQSRILEPTFHQLDYNGKLKISAWDTYKAKNAEYYTGERYFQVSRSLYPQYTRGYIFGYWEDENYYIPISVEETGETYPSEVSF